MPLVRVPGERRVQHAAGGDRARLARRRRARSTRVCSRSGARAPTGSSRTSRRTSRGGIVAERRRTRWSRRSSVTDESARADHQRMRGEGLELRRHAVRDARLVQAAVDGVPDLHPRRPVSPSSLAPRGSRCEPAASPAARARGPAAVRAAPALAGLRRRAAGRPRPRSASLRSRTSAPRSCARGTGPGLAVPALGARARGIERTGDEDFSRPVAEGVRADVIATLAARRARSPR